MAILLAAMCSSFIKSQCSDKGLSVGVYSLQITAIPFGLRASFDLNYDKKRLSLEKPSELGLELEDVAFRECIRLANWYSEEKVKCERERKNCEAIMLFIKYLIHAGVSYKDQEMTIFLNKNE